MIAFSIIWLALNSADGFLGAQEIGTAITSIANAASLYRPPQDPGPGAGVAPGSIVAIFGSNLARSTVVAEGYPLPARIEDTSVMIDGLPAPLLYVSPSQINAIVPNAISIDRQRRGVFYTVGVIVRNGLETSASYGLRITYNGLGLFTMDGSGCGQGLIYQFTADGAVSLNGPENSAQPGKSYLVMLGTGAGPITRTLDFGPPPGDGEATPVQGVVAGGWLPLLAEVFASISRFYEGESDPPNIPSVNAVTNLRSSGRLPGRAAIDYVAFRLPENVPEGCAVPIRGIGAGNNVSQNVTVNIRQGGGQCQVPPVESLSILTWERKVTSGLQPVSITEELRLEFLAAPGKAFPELDTTGFRVGYGETDGPSCPLPSDVQLDAGEITAEAPGWGPVRVPRDGSNIYRIALPSDTIRRGKFSVRGAGGRDVGPFQTTLDIPAPIRPNSYPPETRIPSDQGDGGPPILRWEGGSDDAWVRVGVLSRSASLGRRDWLYEIGTSASDTLLAIPVLRFTGIPPSRDAEIFFTQSGVTPVRFETRGLTGGGLHRYIYRWRFTGIVVKGGDIQ